MKLGRTFRKTGKMILKAQREASRLNEGLNEVLGEDRTRPSDGFSQDRTRRKASLSRKNGDIGRGTSKSFDLSLDSEKSEDKNDREFF